MGKTLVEEEVSRLQEEGNHHFATGDFSTALASYMTALAVQEDVPVLHNNAAIAAIKLQQWPVAMEHANRALVLTQGKDAKAWHRRGTVFFETNMSPLAAFYDFKQALALAPQDKTLRCALYDLRATLADQYPGWREFPERRLDPHWQSILLHMNLDESPLVNLYWDDTPVL
eukprot:GGOE01000786.1.p2 GENE.GGOE01000786.1~~GGOE01000786.1.p2  ORF type:complete len:172 (+),score=31.70 GGOE01000786.1:74-589(+)